MGGIKIKKRAKKPEVTPEARKRIEEIRSSKDCQLILKVKDARVAAQIIADIRAQVDKLESFQLITGGFLPASEALGLTNQLINDPSTIISHASAHADYSYYSFKDDVVGLHPEHLESGPREILLRIVESGFPESYSTAFHELLHVVQCRSLVDFDMRLEQIDQTQQKKVQAIKGASNVLMGISLLVFMAGLYGNIPGFESKIRLVICTLVASVLAAPKFARIEPQPVPSILELDVRPFVEEIHAHFAEATIADIFAGSVVGDNLSAPQLTQEIRRTFAVIQEKDNKNLYEYFLNKYGIDDEGFDQLVKIVMDQIALLTIAGHTQAQIAAMVGRLTENDLSTDGVALFADILKGEELPSAEEAIQIIRDRRTQLRLDMWKVVADRIRNGRPAKLSS